MASVRAAKRYAKGMMMFAEEHGNTKEINQEMIDIKNSIENSRDLLTFLHSRALDPKRKNQIADELFKDFSPSTRHFIKVVINNNREAALKTIAEEYTRMYNEANKVRIAKVVSAVALDKELIDQILEKSRELMGSEYTYEIENEVKPDLIGGFILTVGDKQIDTSVKTRLQELKKEFHINDYIPKF